MNKPEKKLKIKKALFKGSSIVSIITVTGQLLSTILKILISRIYFVEGFGFYALIMAMGRSFASIVQMGYQQSIVHFLAKFRINKDWGNIKHFFITGLRRIVIFALLLSISMVVFKDYITTTFFKDQKSIIIIFISGTMFIIAINHYISSTLRALKLFKEQTIIFTTLYPFLMIISIIVISIIDFQSISITQFLSIGILLNFFVLIIITLLFLKNISKKNSKSQLININQLNNYSYPIWISSILKSVFSSTDRIMLGLISSLQQVGIYGAGLTFSIIFAFPLRVMSPVFQPLIIEQYAKNNHDGMGILYNSLVRFASFFVIPAFGCIICFGEIFIKVFGNDFSSGYEVMVVLSFAQMISTICGTAGTMLNMTDKQKSHTKITFLGVIINIILNILLISRYSALGAAYGTGISVIIINFLRVRAIINYYNIKTNYSTTLWLFIKMIPLIVLCTILIKHNHINWMIVLFGFIIISILIIYYSLTKNEKLYLKNKIKNKIKFNV